MASNGDSAAEDSGFHGLGSHVVYLTLKADSRTKVENVRLDKSLAAAFVTADGNPAMRLQQADDGTNVIPGNTTGYSTRPPQTKLNVG